MLTEDGFEIFICARLLVSFAFVMAYLFATIGEAAVSFMPIHILVLMSARQARTVCEAS